MGLTNRGTRKMRKHALAGSATCGDVAIESLSHAVAL
jgi:hypothetical protein